MLLKFHNTFLSAHYFVVYVCCKKPVTNDSQMSKTDCILIINQWIFYLNLLKSLKLKAHSDSHSKSPYLPLFNQHVMSCSCCSYMHCATPSVDDVSLITMVSKLVGMQAGSLESTKNPEWNRLNSQSWFGCTLVRSWAPCYVCITCTCRIHTASKDSFHYFIIVCGIFSWLTDW